jgi:2-keto-3-deoxy-L-rhamnonate aldolase RhmA
MLQIKHLLDARQTVRVMSFGNLATPNLVEMSGRLAKIHGAWFDQEHSAISQGELELLVMAARAAGIDAFARVPPSDYVTIMRPYEAGCSGIMVAQIRTIDEVEEVVAWAKYPPLGRRGIYGSNAECNYGMTDMQAHVERANRERWIAIQIETAEALDNVEHIASTAGVDWIFVGPADLSLNLGIPGEFGHPRFLEALVRISAACRANGKPWGTLCLHIDYARKCRELDCGLFSLHGDSVVVRAGLAAVERQFAEFMEC